jgi:ribosomal protein S18 acetylase RimI-like enzyme
MAEAATVRRLTFADLSEYKAIRFEMLAESPSAYGATLASARARPEAFWRTWLDDAFALGADVEGELAGTARFHRQGGPKDNHKADLTAMFVRPRFRRRGVARTLLQAGEAILGPEVEQILLDVVDANAGAIALYTAEGFETYGLARQALKGPDGYANEIQMVKFLSGAPARG